MTYKLCATAMLGLMLAGCSANIAVEDITSGTNPNVDGVPFRTAKPYMAHIFKKTGAGYVELGQKGYPVTVPDPSRLYVMHFNGQAFANGSVDLALNPDGTIQSVHVKSTTTAPTDLTDAGTALSGVATALATARTTDATQSKARQDALLAAEQAKAAADVAILQRQNLQTNASASMLDLLQAQSAERIAKITANQAALRAGMPSYFPDVPALPPG